ncbi:MGH1-like glycoside hydrolase domain-containing protein [Chryseosolibacter indicus]|uniref:Glucosidase n=1 Tax=Chryseosolibacter indicus TaxID=2782351 RepID=A0ABS5VK76_9BACT|nr:glucosidase [Chryseosolibacter indicus]MBT1701845.1 glucosidase [Chryseosolibacter indicus]
MNEEKKRLIQDKLKQKDWRKFGPYLSERQWGTVREDYSANGDAWGYITHDAARSKAYRWGEEGIGGVSDDKQLLCFAFAFWNKKDPILKERLFGLSNPEGNHGEDCKELYYYLDNTPTHSYMKMLYKYPHEEYPYIKLLEENKRRDRGAPEYEITDTGVFDNNAYFDIEIEYAKADVSDLLIRVTIYNRGEKSAAINLLPTLWLRNTWSWGIDEKNAEIFKDEAGVISAHHPDLDTYYLYYEDNIALLFCENETNTERLYGYQSNGTYKDGINDFLIHNKHGAVSDLPKGTKASLNYDLALEAGDSKIICLRISSKYNPNPFKDFQKIFDKRIEEADDFYAEMQHTIESADLRNIQRQAIAGMLWSKQFYYFDVDQWLRGDEGQPKPPRERMRIRNYEWLHLNNADVISMPDKWEYPWYAAWDLAFHTIPLAMVDPEFAKKQLLLLTKEWYMHPNGQLPAYEWSFSDVNPPVHGWAAWRVYKIDSKLQGKNDRQFLEEIFHKLLLNFTWWVNRKDYNGNNIFQGGFLGMDNIGVFDRSASLPDGGFIEQSDGTSWMAMFTLNMMRMSLELAKENPTYQSLATKFFEHFLYIADAMANVGNNGISMWDEEDEFFYDVLHTADDQRIKMKVRSMVGLVPLFAVEVLDQDIFDAMPEFTERLQWFLKNRPHLANLISRWAEKGRGERHLLSLLRGHRMKCLLRRMLDEEEFLSAYGVRALSKYHETHPYSLFINNGHFTVAYNAGESDSSLFGGNSNWRGPIWFPVNFLIIESLQRFHHYYGDDFLVEHPTGSGIKKTLREIADDLASRMVGIFTEDETGRRPVFGNVEKFQSDPYFKNNLLFYEYFNGDNGAGLGASHQTGWTGLIAKLIQPRNK